MPQLKGLIFDLDGTLLDSAPDLRQALNKTLETHGCPPLSILEVQNLTGDGLMPMLSRAFAKIGKPISTTEAHKLFQEFVNNYHTLKADPTQLYPHVQTTIEMYHKAGVKIGLCTNKQEASTHRLIADLELTSLFTFIAGGDTFPNHKPHPDHVRGVIDMLKVPAENCVMVGDSYNDVAAAHGAGIPCIAVSHGYGDVSSLGADALMPNFKELPSTLERLGFNLV